MTSFPALDDFERDPEVTFARWRVYTFLRRNALTFHAPKLVKVGAVERQIVGSGGQHMRRHALVAAINWLAAHGYLIEHGRDGRIRRLTLAYSRAQQPSASDATAAPSCQSGTNSGRR